MIKRFYIAATGGGAGAQNMIWQTPGCSSYFAGATFPYGHEQLEEFIGYAPEKSVCEETAVEMAMMAYYNAYRYGNDEEFIGIGCTAALAPNKRDRNVYYISIVDKNGVKTRVFDFANGTRTRNENGCSVDNGITRLIQGEFWDMVDSTDTAKKLLLKRPYWADNKRYSELAFTSQFCPADDHHARIGRAIYPGAFNPPHRAHFEIAKKTDAVFSIELCSPHKGELAVHEILQRLKLLKGNEVLLTRGLPLYVDKSNKFPGCPIVLGSDSLVRMLDPKWGPDPIKLLQEMSQNETRLYVVGRMVNGKYVSANEAISLIPESATCYQLVPVDLSEEFQGLSSSAIRVKNGV
jgi:nicotinamide mononucleotide (NMN) deamidase PncC